MVDEVFKSSGYVLTGGSNIDSLYKSSGYIILGSPGNVFRTSGYIITGSPGAVSRSSGYIIIQPFYPPESDLVTELGFNENGGVAPLSDCISCGSSGGPGFKTSIYEFDSGITATNIDWDQIRARYTVTLDRLPFADVQVLENLFYSCKGRAIGFRYKDWLDYTITTQNVFVGNGSSRQFQLFKRYSSGGYFYDRMIYKPITSTFRMAVDNIELVNGTDFDINFSTGLVTMLTPPDAGSIVSVVYGEFDIPVRFDTDFLDISFDEFQQLSVGSVPLIELAVAS